MTLQIDPNVRDQFRVRVEDGVKKNILAKKPVMIGVAGVAFVVFVMLLSGAWHSGDTTEGENAIPVVAASDDALKVKPEGDAASVGVPGQDSLVYNQFEEEDSPSPVENLLPVPEKPMQVAVPAPVVSAPQPTVATPARTETLKPVAATPVRVAEPKTVSSSGDYMVQVGSLSSQAKAEQEWARLQKKFPAVLGSLELHVERADLGAKGVYYRIQVGPLTQDGAKKTCADLKSGVGGCIVVKR